MISARPGVQLQDLRIVAAIMGVALVPAMLWARVG